MTDDGGTSSAIARLHGPAGEVLGAGFLVTADLVVTCAHVLDPAGEQPPAGPVRVDFPLAGHTAQARVAGWTPLRDGDIAVLRLAGPVPVRPARLTATVPRWGDPVRVLGFPADLAEYGVWAAAELRDRQAAGWLQVESTTPGRVIEAGFSGAPVFSPAVGGVIGMVVAADRGAGHNTGYLLPARALVAAHPELGAPDAAEESPYRGLEPFLQEHAGQFRGREELTADMVALARAQPLILLTGPSGSGKSSLVQAGVVPRLRRDGRAVATVRTLPGTTAAVLLAGAVQPVLDPDAGEADRLDATLRLAERFAQDRAATVRWVAGRLADLAPDGVLLVLDQLEEAAPADAREVVGLLHDLGAAAGRRSGGEPRVVAVATLRSGMIDEVVTEATRQTVRAGWVPVPPMTAGQLQAAVTPAGVEFEPGLVRRLIEDAGDEPGRLPLLEFTLDRLWALRRMGTLTHEAYDEVGGLSGAVARYAGVVYHSLEPADRARARRLLTRLARPIGDGDFQRHPVRLDDLDDELRPVLSRLAASRLVVIGRTTSGVDIADLAHQALIRQWPLLREWLAADRDFRLWQEDLRRGREAWTATAKDPGGLLRGAALSTARSWAGDRPADLTEADRAYLRASEAHERRRVRVLWSVIAVVSALAVLGGGLAVVAVGRNNLAQRKLHEAASRQLADDSIRFRGIDPPRALQLAQAAWREAHTPEAYGALFTQYAGLQTVDRLFRDLWAGDLDRITTSRDGDVAAFSSAGGAAVWTGLTGAEPRRIVLTDPDHRNVGGTARLSPSGRYLGYANDLGGVAVWDLSRPDAPIRLAGDRYPDDTTGRLVGSLAFSADESRLLALWHTYAGGQPELAAWEIAGARPVRLAPGMAGAAQPQLASFGPADDQIVLTGAAGIEVYRAGSGRLMRRFPAPRSGGLDVVAEHGASVLSCRDETLRVLGTADGREQRSIAVPTCAGLAVDGNTGFAVLARTLDAGVSNAFVSLVDPHSGRAYRATTPPVDIAAGFNLTDPAGTLAVYRGPDGAPTALLGDQGGLLYRVRAGPPVVLQLPEFRPLDARGRAVTPDGTREVRIGPTGELQLYDVRTNRLIARAAAPPPPPGFTFTGVWYAVTADGSRLLVTHQDRLAVYRLPDLTVERRIDLPVPDLGPPPATDLVSDAWASSVLPGADRPGERDDVLVLHAGVLTRWNLATGQQVGAAVPLRSGSVGARRRAATLAFAPARRPGHPDQVAVVLPAGTVQIWSMSEGRAIAEVQWPASQTENAVLFNPAGTRFAASGADGLTAVWDTDDVAAGGKLIPTVVGDYLLGFTPDNLVTVRLGGDRSAQLWSTDRGKRLTVLTAPADTGSWQLVGDTLTSYGEGLTRTLELKPAMWFDRLCAMNDRPFTKAELTSVEANQAAATPPCEDR